MTTLPITPPVAPEVLAAVEQAARNGKDVKADLTIVQKVVTADKSAIVAAAVHVAVLIVAAVGLKLDGEDVAVLGSIVTAGLSYFVTLNLAKK